MSFHLSVIEEADALLIEKVRVTSILYNNHYADFRHAPKKDKAWEEVANSLGITKADAKRRWTCLRDRYTRELKELRSKSPRKDDCGTGEFFQFMDFLRPFVRKRRPNKQKLDVTIKSELDSAKKIKLHDIEAVDFQSEEGTEDQYEKESPDEYNYIACEYPIETYEEFTEVPENSPAELTVSDQVSKNTKNSLIPIMFPSGTVGTTSLESPTVTTEQQAQSQIHSQVTPLQQPQVIENMEFKQKEKETEDDFFCKSVAIYLRKLSRLHKIKAKVEMFQILEKYIEIEENSTAHILSS